MTQELNNNKPISVSKIFTDIRFIILIVGIVLSAVFFITQPDTEMRERMIRIEDTLTVIETNHLAHIEAAIGNNKEAIECNQDTIIELLLQVRELQTQIQETH